MWKLMKSKYPNKCKRCDKDIEVGQNIRWHTETKDVLHRTCWNKTYGPHRGQKKKKRRGGPTQRPAKGRVRFVS